MYINYKNSIIVSLHFNLNYLAKVYKVYLHLINHAIKIWIPVKLLKHN